MNDPLPHHVHLIGIGGAHMSAIARILLSWGHEISGSDLRGTPATDALVDLGADVHIGPHDASYIGDASLVVHTSAARPENPEIAAALARGIPLVKRADMVARLMQGLVGVCVAGCHGKSTTSGLVAYMLEQAGLDPTYLIGAEVNALGNNAKAGSGSFVVVEADEYDRAFLSYSPKVALVTNVEADHLDYYLTWEAIQAAFRQFASQVLPDGTLILCADNAEALDLCSYAQPGVHIETYSVDAPTQPAATPGAVNWTVTDVEVGARQTFVAHYRGERFGDFTISLPGRHNLQNALGAVAIGRACGLDAGTIARGLEGYSGVRRRFELVGEVNDILLMDDYAHHPTEVRALAAAARARFPDRRIVALFQPHTFARTRYLLDGFRTCFEGFDRLYLLETYAAREAIADGMTAKDLAAEVTTPPPTYTETFEEAAEVIARELRPGDVFFTVGAGDLDIVGPLILKRLESQALKP